MLKNTNVQEQKASLKASFFFFFFKLRATILSSKLFREHQNDDMKYGV